MSNPTRRQATLYLPLPHSVTVEALRSRFNPVQFGLIRAHVTLCREDEASDWDSVVSWLREIGAVEVALSFGKPMREGNLVYLPALGGMSSFDALRKLLLAPNGAPPRVHSPYITLIHPRNGTCSDSDFAELAGACEPFSATFRNVTLIEQVDSLSWRDVATSG